MHVKKFRSIRRFIQRQVSINSSREREKKMETKNAKRRFITSVIVLIILGFCCQSAMADRRAWIETDKRVYNRGERIRVYFYNAPGYSRDWICIVGAGAPDTSAGDYQYMPNGAQRGVITFRSPGPGRYEARAYYNYRAGQYYVSARYRFRVR